MTFYGNSNGSFRLWQIVTRHDSSPSKKKVSSLVNVVKRAIALRLLVRSQSLTYLYLIHPAITWVSKSDQNIYTV